MTDTDPPTGHFNAARCEPQADNVVQFHCTHAYTAVSVRDDVPLVRLIEALTLHGLTLSNVPRVGLVIHPAPKESA